jgi:hypothetical protein
MILKYKHVQITMFKPLKQQNIFIYKPATTTLAEQSSIDHTAMGTP